MPIFDVGSPAYQGPTTVGTSSNIRIWSGTNTALVNANPTAVTVRDLMVQNTGTSTVFLGGSSVAASGMGVPPGAIMVIQGWTAITGTTTNDVFAVCNDFAGTTTVVAGLGTLISVV